MAKNKKIKRGNSGVSTFKQRICIIISIFCGLSLLLNLFNILLAVSTYQKTSAQIIYVSYHKPKLPRYTGVDLMYSVDNMVYNLEIDYRKNSWQEGAYTDIYYNPENASRAVNIDYEIHNILFYLFFLSIMLYQFVDKDFLRKRFEYFEYMEDKMGIIMIIIGLVISKI